jgi:hypothetical protein
VLSCTWRNGQEAVDVIKGRNSRCYPNKLLLLNFLRSYLLAYFNTPLNWMLRLIELRSDFLVPKEAAAAFKPSKTISN